MARKYELKRRAERQEETRRRIVEAAVELHRTKGPARTTLSDVARRAGVQRHTLYRHFPDERALFTACSGHFYELNPFPDPEPWQAIADPEARLRAGLAAIYDYFEQTEDMLTSTVRDAEIHPLTQEVAKLRRGRMLERVQGVLGEHLPDTPRVRAALALALDFYTWRSLVRRSGLSNEEAVETMVAALRCL
jgi:AcrR family transcriptional regulator